MYETRIRGYAIQNYREFLKIATQNRADGGGISCSGGKLNTTYSQYSSQVDIHMLFDWEMFFYVMETQFPFRIIFNMFWTIKYGNTVNPQSHWPTCYYLHLPLSSYSSCSRLYSKMNLCKYQSLYKKRRFCNCMPQVELLRRKLALNNLNKNLCVES